MKYELTLNVGIRQCDDRGAPVYGNGQLQVAEEIRFDAGSFLEIAHVLGRFHELGQEIRSNGSS